MRFATLISETGLKFCLLFLWGLQLNNTSSHICLISTFRHNLKEASILGQMQAFGSSARTWLTRHRAPSTPRIN